MRKLPILCLLTVALAGLSRSVEAAPILYSVQSNGNDHLYSIDAATGSATDLGLVGFGDAEGLAFAGSTLYAIGGTDDVLWDITSPPGALVGATGPRSRTDAGLDYDPTTGTMYNLQGDGAGSSLYTVNLTTGATSLVGSSGTFGDGLGINGSGAAFAVDGIFTDSLYSVNLTTGALTLIGGLGLGDISTQFGLTFADGTLYGLSPGGQLYTFNTTTGAATLVANTVCGTALCGNWEGLAAPSSEQPVPEPASLTLLGLGLAGMGARRWRQRKQ